MTLPCPVPCVKALAGRSSEVDAVVVTPLFVAVVPFCHMGSVSWCLYSLMWKPHTVWAAVKTAAACTLKASLLGLGVFSLVLYSERIDDENEQRMEECGKLFGEIITFTSKPSQLLTGGKSTQWGVESVLPWHCGKYKPEEPSFLSQCVFYFPRVSYTKTDDKFIYIYRKFL